MKILENNGIEIENIDGAAFNEFLAGKDGVVKGVLDECIVYKANSNMLKMGTGLILVHGVRIKMVKETSLNIPSNSFPATPIRYRYILTLELKSDKSFDVSFKSEEFSNRELIKEDLYKTNQGKYELELFRYTIDANGYTDIVRVFDIIAGGGSGTSVTVGGEAQNTWDADTKLDKYTEVSNTDRYYGVDENGNQYVGYVMKKPTYVTAGYLATYFSKTKAGDIIGGGGRAVLLTDTPEKPYQAANKLYVDDGLSGKVPITPDGFPETYAGLFGKTGAGEIEIVSKTMYWDNIESLTGYNNNGSVAGYSHRATGENVLYTGTPDMPSQAANKKYVDEGLNNKVDKVTTAFRIYGTGESGNQIVYPTGWSVSSGILQITDYTPNGGYTDDGSFDSYITGTHKVGIPSKPSHATPKKWVEDNFTVYKHLILFATSDASPEYRLEVYSTNSTPFTSLNELPDNMPYTAINYADCFVWFFVKFDGVFYGVWLDGQASSREENISSLYFLSDTVMEI